MLKYIIFTFLIFTFLVGHYLPHATAATARDNAARQFERKMNDLNIQHINYNSFNDQYDDESDQNYNRNLIDDNYSAQSNINTSLQDINYQHNSNWNGGYENNYPEDNLQQQIKDLENDMDDVIRRLSKLERELQTKKEKHISSQKTTKNKIKKQKKNTKSKKKAK